MMTWGFEVAAFVDKPTIVNIVQHPYINMAGYDAGDARDTILQRTQDT